MRGNKDTPTSPVPLSPVKSTKLSHVGMWGETGPFVTVYKEQHRELFVKDILEEEADDVGSSISVIGEIPFHNLPMSVIQGEIPIIHPYPITSHTCP